MKNTIIILSLLISVVANAEEFPRRKSGLWQIEHSDNTQGVKNIIKQCLDQDTDKKMQEMGNNMAGRMKTACSKPQNKREGGNFIVETSCTFGGSKVYSKSVFSGNFDTEYRGETETTYTPPLQGLSSSKGTINAKYLGPCQADQRPGDIIMPNGIKMNIEDMAKSMTQTAAELTRNTVAKDPPDKK